MTRTIFIIYPIISGSKFMVDLSNYILYAYLFLISYHRVLWMSKKCEKKSQNDSIYLKQYQIWSSIFKCLWKGILHWKSCMVKILHLSISKILNLNLF